LKVKVKSWIEKNDEAVFGGGSQRLLELVEQTGSLNKAAKAMKMSYRAAWGKVRQMEKRLGKKLVDSSIGGVKGGGSVLTEQAKQLLLAYSKMEAEITKYAKSSFARNFNQPDND